MPEKYRLWKLIKLLYVYANKSTYNIPRPTAFYKSELIRDLGCRKEYILGSNLRKKELSPVSSCSWYRNREKYFSSYFFQEGDLVLLQQCSWSCVSL